MTEGAFFSVAEFFHPYYTVMLAPAIAALAAIGVATLWRAYRTRGWRGWLVIEQDQFLRASDTPESVVAVQRANREYLRQFGI